MPRLLILILALLVSPGLLAANPQVELRTSLGAITVELYPERAPVTVKNFLQYAESGFYNGTIFHRVIDGFMIQGGGFTSELVKKPTRPPIPIESQNGLRNDVGTIAMARTSDPNSATSEFYINLVSNDFLNYPGRDGHGYTVFGKITKGMEVVEKIAKIPTAIRAPHQQNVPVETVTITSARVVGAPAKKPAK
jgi:cyclophilin family peptidyl-prolyl cis-trans isomerase